MRPPPAEPRRALLALASLGVFLAAADTYVVVLALPDIMLGVGLDIDELQRAAPIVSAFLLGYVVVLPVIGRLSDLHGRLPVIVGCLALFALGSLCTATAEELGRAVTGRALQGVGAGGLVPVTLALVADRWTEERRGVPLGLVGAVQELGTVAGPLYAGAVLALSGWRAIFWVNLGGAVVLAVGLLAVSRTRPPLRPTALGLLALGGAVLTLTAPEALATDVTLGRAFEPLVGGNVLTSPVSLATLVLLVALVAVSTDGSAVRRTLRQVDVLGGALAGLALSGVVLTFATADPGRQVVADDAPLLLTGAAVFAALFVLRQRRVSNPLVPPGAVRSRAARAALVTSVLVGAALVTALVDVPVFARATRYPDSQWGASLVLVRLLVALPVGAILGGWLCARVPPRLVAAVGMLLAAAGFVAMARWTETSLDGPASLVVLLVTGLGFGLAVAPVNQILLSGTEPAVHGIAAALVVVARTTGMLVGLSALTAVGLHVFYSRLREIGSPLVLCPRDPGDCPAYEVASKAALLSELHAIFLGAALCAVAAAAVVLSSGSPDRRRPEPARNGPRSGTSRAR